MQAQTHSPGTIFGSHIRYVVPLFQRPYVWNEKDQWQPLWDDITSLAEAVLDAPAQPMYGAPLVPPHFLGAVVLDQKPSPSGYIAVRHIIDGQQRLTTLQLLLDAAQGDLKELHSSQVVNPGPVMRTDQTHELDTRTPRTGRHAPPQVGRP